MRDILSSLPKIFEGGGANDAAVEAIVFAAWKKAAGDGLERHAVPVRFIRKRLIVAVASETWRKQVTDLAGQLVFKLNAVLGSPMVSLVEFRIDAKAVSAYGQAAEADLIAATEWNELANDELTPELREAAQAIADEELRSAFLAAAGSSLAGRRKRIA